MSVAYLVLIPFGVQNYHKKEREDRARRAAEPSNPSPST
jgi:hypothetical protein